MDWSFIFALGMGVVGVALLVGGIVGYLGSKRVGFRAMSAGLAAAGGILLAVLGLALPLSRTSGGDTPVPTPVVEFTPVTAATATPTPTPTPGPWSECDQYLRLTVSWQGQQEQAVATSYHCDGLWVDFAGQAPSSKPSLTLAQGAPLDVRLDVPTERNLEQLEARLYTGAGKYAMFSNWPESLPGGAMPVAIPQPPLSSAFQAVPPVGPGEYSLVVRASWEGPVDVFYAAGFKVE